MGGGSGVWRGRPMIIFVLLFSPFLCFYRPICGYYQRNGAQCMHTINRPTDRRPVSDDDVFTDELVGGCSPRRVQHDFRQGVFAGSVELVDCRWRSSGCKPITFLKPPTFSRVRHSATVGQICRSQYFVYGDGVRFTAIFVCTQTTSISECISVGCFRSYYKNKIGHRELRIDIVFNSDNSQQAFSKIFNRSATETL